jgi:hypothetical protein
VQTILLHRALLPPSCDTSHVYLVEVIMRNISFFWYKSKYKNDLMIF